MTNLTPEQMMADVKLLRAACVEGCDCDCPNWEEWPQRTCQVCEALATTDRPEYKEEG